MKKLPFEKFWVWPQLVALVLALLASVILMLIALVRPDMFPLFSSSRQSDPLFTNAVSTDLHTWIGGYGVCSNLPYPKNTSLTCAYRNYDGSKYKSVLKMRIILTSRIQPLTIPPFRPASRRCWYN